LSIDPQTLERRLLDLIETGAGDFETLALEVFAFQFERNAAYRAYCTRAGRTPDTVAQWQDIPAVPTAAFKEMNIACFPVAEAVAEFHTSGTTAEKSGKHFFKTLDLYHAAIRPNFAAHLLPEWHGGPRSVVADNAADATERVPPAPVRLPMFVLAPSPEDAPHSSLSHMMGEVVRDFGAAGSGFYASPTDGAVRAPRPTGTPQLDLQRLVRDLQEVTEPVFLLGTAFAFVHLFDAGVKLELPSGSRAMETGGFKGRSRVIPKPELYSLFERQLGIPASMVVNEYGMTELSTQFYDRSLREGRQTDRKDVPPWARVLVIDPHTSRVAPTGEKGLIRVFDSANLWSSLCIQTEDLGVAGEDGSFEVLERAPGADVRGCSLSAESWSQS
jgi:hypothetical protein